MPWLVGGIGGGLIGAGIPEHEAKVYEREIRRGNLLVVVQVDGDDEKTRVAGILREVDAVSVSA